MFLEFMHMWLASWVYIYFAIKHGKSRMMRFAFILCMIIYTLVHLIVIALLIAALSRFF